MYCSKCGTEYNDGDKFCKGCGIDLQNKVVDAGPSKVVKNYDVKKINAKNNARSHKIMLGALAILVIVGAVSNYINPSTDAKATNSDTKITANAELPKSDNSSTLKPTPAPVKAIQVDASELVKQYDGNVLKADSLYKDKLVGIVGTISEIGNSWDKPSIAIESNTGIMGTSLICYFDKSQVNSLLELNQGYRVIISGTVTGKIVGSVAINKCTLVGCEQLDKAAANKKKAAESNKQ